MLKFWNLFIFLINKELLWRKIIKYFRIKIFQSWTWNVKNEIILWHWNVEVAMVTPHSGHFSWYPFAQNLFTWLKHIHRIGYTYDQYLYISFACTWSQHFNSHIFVCNMYVHDQYIHIHNYVHTCMINT